jgi:hypothetical protein
MQRKQGRIKLPDATDTNLAYPNDRKSAVVNLWNDKLGAWRQKAT